MLLCPIGKLYTGVDTVARTKKKEMTSLLPATPCSPDMRSKMVVIAEQQGKSLAQVQREAYTFFLSRNNSHPIPTAS